MDEFVSFGSRAYATCFLVLLLGRGMDFLSTWVATPNLVLEGNPIAKRLGWHWGILLNLAVCVLLSFWPVSAIAVSTTSVLVAARNFQSAWLMRSLGEEVYRDWHVARIQETRVTLYLFCLAGNTLLTAAVGGAVILFSGRLLVPFAIGLGIIAYAVAVAFYTLLATWRLRRSGLQPRRRLDPVRHEYQGDEALSRLNRIEY
ncbi:MAG: hypothetical protein P8Z30_18995 [Acidobacteriota bacterium]